MGGRPQRRASHRLGQRRRRIIARPRAPRRRARPDGRLLLAAQPTQVDESSPPSLPPLSSSSSLPSFPSLPLPVQAPVFGSQLPSLQVTPAHRSDELLSHSQLPEQIPADAASLLRHQLCVSPPASASWKQVLLPGQLPSEPQGIEQTLGPSWNERQVPPEPHWPDEPAAHVSQTMQSDGTAPP